MSSLDAWGLLVEEESTCSGSSFMLLREDVRLVVELSEGDMVGPGLSQRLGMGWA